MLGFLVAQLQLGPNEVVSFLIGGALSAAGLVGVIATNRREATASWRELAEAKGAEVDDLKDRLTKVEAKVGILESDFVTRVVDGVSKEVARWGPK